MSFENTNNLLINTIINRPYVVGFLISYLFIAKRMTNWTWVISYLFCGYTIAFTSEFLSINFGFPYGWYFYKYSHLTGEWLNHGVPVWDSASYVFMCFAGLCVASHINASTTINPTSSANNNRTPRISSVMLVIWSAVFTTLLDVIVDPVAHRGAEWFLGDIYFYPNPGPYFNVTLANFAGWLLVSFLINATGVFLLGFLKIAKHNKLNTFLGLGLYFGIFCFGIFIAILIKAWLILLADLFWLTLVLIVLKRRKNKSLG